MLNVFYINTLGSILIKVINIRCIYKILTKFHKIQEHPPKIHNNVKNLQKCQESRKPIIPSKYVSRKKKFSRIPSDLINLS